MYLYKKTWLNSCDNRILFFCFNYLFKWKCLKLGLLVIKESIACQIFPIVPHFLTPFKNSFSCVISFLISRTIMGFKEWNLDKALYYIGFNFIISFHFQYSASDPIIFGNNNILVIVAKHNGWKCLLMDFPL